MGVRSDVAAALMAAGCPLADLLGASESWSLGKSNKTLTVY